MGSEGALVRLGRQESWSGARERRLENGSKRDLLLGSVQRRRVRVPSRHAAQEDCKAGAQDSPDVGDRMEESWGAAESGLDSLHDPRARASHPAVQAPAAEERPGRVVTCWTFHPASSHPPLSTVDLPTAL